MGRVAGFGPPRRRLVPGWVALVGAVAALLALIYLPWQADQDFADVTFRTWTCPEAPAPTTGGSELRSSCEPSVEALQLRLFQGSSSSEPDHSDQQAVVYERVSTASVDFSLQVTLDAPAEQVLLRPAAHGEEPRSAFHGDAAGLRWTSYWRPSGRTEFDVLVVPRDAG